MTKVLPLLLLVASFAADAGAACGTPPVSLRRDHKELLDEASAVLLLVAQQDTQSSNSCRLRVLRALKGTPPEYLPIDCVSGSSSDFKGHTEQAFWGRQGRLEVAADCTLGNQPFYVGHRYLLLLGVKPDTKQSEQINDEHDAWLSFAERYLYDGNAAYPAAPGLR